MKRRKIEMNGYDLYIANVRGQKLSSYYRVYANSVSEAQAKFRKSRPDWDWLNLEVLAAI